MHNIYGVYVPLKFQNVFQSNVTTSLKTGEIARNHADN